MLSKGGEDGDCSVHLRYSWILAVSPEATSCLSSSVHILTAFLPGASSSSLQWGVLLSAFLYLGPKKYFCHLFHIREFLGLAANAIVRLCNLAQNNFVDSLNMKS